MVRVVRVKVAHLLYAVGVLCGGLAGWLSPFPYLGFIPVAVGCVWAAYDLYDDGEELVDGNTPPTPPRR